MSTPERTADVELSIGEVLELIQQDFPDVTISKIRFLESQGLIQPGRTASGYRRFNSADIDRLRWILRQQRDHFLPLKVIRHMLDEGIDRFDDGDATQPTLWSRIGDGDGDPDRDDDADDLDVDALDADALDPDDLEDPDDPDGPDDPDTPDHLGDAGGPGGPGGPVGRGLRPASVTPVPDPPAPVVDRPPARPAATGSGPAEPPRRVLETPADVVAALQEDPRPRRRPTPSRPPLWADRPEVDQPTRTADELCVLAGIDADLLAELERFGLVRPAQRAGEAFYGDAALEVARLAARAATHGIDARHLRMYLVSAEREAGFIEQLAVPLLKQRNPAGRRAAVELSAELASIGADLHAALLRRELGPVLGEQA